MKRFLLPSVFVLLAVRTPAWPQAHHVVEAEPNNTSGAANRAALGDTLIGTISNASDVDFFVLDIPGATFVTIHSEIRLCLIDQDGVTLLQCNPEDYPMNFPVITAGRYYIRLDGTALHTGQPIIGPYQLAVLSESFPLDAGDPVRWFKDVPSAERVVSGLNGELYVRSPDRVLRISPDGDTTTLASGLSPYRDLLIDLRMFGDMVVDAFGDIIVARSNVCGSGAQMFLRISPTGEQSALPVIPGFSPCGLDPPAMTVGPDGDLWVANHTGIVRLDPTGVKKDEVPLGSPSALAAAPSGDLYVAGGSGCSYGIAVVRRTTIECFLPDIASRIAAGRTPPYLELAIDQDGNLYVGQEIEDWGAHSLEEFGHIDVFPPGSTTPHPYAHVPSLNALTFARDAQGNMTSRLFAINAGSMSKLVELNGAGARPVGAGFAVRFFHAAMDPLPPATLGVTYSRTLHVTTDATSLIWSVENGSLPPGLTLSSAGVLQGTPGNTGTFEFTVRATSGGRGWFAPGTIRVAPHIPVDVPITQVIAALLGGPALSPAQVEYFDQLGNKNGILDVGDLRAYLRAHGQLH